MESDDAIKDVCVFAGVGLLLAGSFKNYPADSH